MNSSCCVIQNSLPEQMQENAAGSGNHDPGSIHHHYQSNPDSEKASNDSTDILILLRTKVTNSGERLLLFDCKDFETEYQDHSRKPRFDLSLS